MARLLHISVFVSILLTVTTATWAVDYKVVILHPEGFYESIAMGISGGQQVGRGWNPDYYEHALLWSGTADSMVDLNPSGLDYSEAYGISGNQQVGRGHGSATGGQTHAVLWSGSAETWVDLNPVGFDHSWAWDISGG